MQLSQLERSLMLGRFGPRLLPETDGGGSGGSSEGTSGKATEDTSGAKSDDDSSDDLAGIEGLGDAGREAIRRERAAAKAAEDRAKDAAKKLAALEKKVADTEAEEAKKRGDFEKLAQDRQARIEELEHELKTRDQAELKRKIAAEFKLPADLAERLIGDDEAALREDAKTLAKTVGTRKAPDTEGGTGSTSTNGASDRPIKPKAQSEESGTKPTYTFEGKRKVAWPNR